MQISSRTVLRVGAALLALVIIAGLLLFANGLVGNPISRFIVNRSARQHVAATYPDMNLELEQARYDFKSSNYYVHVKSSTSVDTHFTLRFTASGVLHYDDYEFRVVGGSNTFERINSEYSLALRAVIDSDDFPYNSHIYFSRITPYHDHKDYGPKYGLKLELLELDKVYDVMDLAKTAGHIVLYIEDEEVTMTKAAEVLLGVKNILDSKDISFYAIDFELIKPRGDEKPALDEPRVYIREFLCDDIYEEGLVERVAAADQALREYYAEQDATYKD